MNDLKVLSVRMLCCLMFAIYCVYLIWTRYQSFGVFELVFVSGLGLIVDVFALRDCLEIRKAGL